MHQNKLLRLRAEIEGLRQALTQVNAERQRALIFLLGVLKKVGPVHLGEKDEVEEGAGFKTHVEGEEIIVSFVSKEEVAAHQAEMRAAAPRLVVPGGNGNGHFDATALDGPAPSPAVDALADALERETAKMVDRDIGAPPPAADVGGAENTGEAGASPGGAT